MMPNTSSNLNWIDGKNIPTLDQIIGKTVILQMVGSPKCMHLVQEMTSDDYNNWFFDDPIHRYGTDGPILYRYAIIDMSEPEEELLPLWDVIPRIERNYFGFYFVFDAIGSGKDVFTILGFSRASRQEVISDWNKIRNSLKDIRL